MDTTQRQDLIERAMGAQHLDEINDIRADLLDWMRENPDDDRVALLEDHLLHLEATMGEQTPAAVDYRLNENG